MSDAKITKDVYKQYANKIATVLDNEEFYEQFKKRVDSGASSFKLGKKRLIQDISIDWIDTIEEILPNLDTIVRNPRRFIVQEEDIVDVSLARSISTESVKFLAQHTNMISKVEDDGSVIPSKILNITKEESFEIYENRFIYTLLLKLKDFVTMRYDKIKKASATQDVLELDVESRFNLPSKKITFRTEYFAQLSFDEVMRLDPDTLTKIERVAKIDRIITDFLSSSFAKSMRNSAPVRPPIMRTNVILKEPNFKKALVLWQFIETYNQTAGFSTTDDVEELKLEDTSVENLRRMVTLNTMLFESMYEEFETDMDMEDKQFGDFLRVGEMDFEKDEIDRDEYAQKLEQKKENDDEDKNIEEVRPEEEPEAEHEIPPEEQEQPPEQPPEEPEQPEQPEEQEPEETPKSNQIIQEKEVERPVEVERYREMAPKADQEEVDLEPDAVKFDQHLFEVRKLYKRPDDDKLKQEDIAKVRDAIDRCLTSYRRIKQEELDELERDDRIRRRKDDIAKRALAFNKQREELSKSVDNMQSTDMYFGMDPFSYQKAKLAREKLEQDRLEQIKLNKDEKLELEGDKESIEKEIAQMESSSAEQTAPEEEIAPAPVEEFNQPANEEDLPAKKGLRLSDGEENIDPWAKKEEKPQKEIEKVDENKVAVGGITFKEGSGIYDPFAEESAGNLGNKAETRKEEPQASEQSTEEKPKPKRKPRKKKQPADEQAQSETSQTESPTETSDSAEKPQSESDAPAADAIEAKEESAEQTPAEKSAEPQTEGPAKPKRTRRSSKNKGELSPTTVNQKYSKPSGRKLNLSPVDEAKVAVGGITFKEGSGIYDPFATGGAEGLGNKAESSSEQANSVENDDATTQTTPAEAQSGEQTPAENHEESIEKQEEPVEKQEEPAEANDETAHAEPEAQQEGAEQPSGSSDSAPADEPTEEEQGEAQAQSPSDEQDQQ